jgi:predicted nucleic acid-binding protein
VDILVDTNILLRRIHRRDPRHHQTRDAVKRLLDEGHRLCVTSQNLVEFWVVCTRPAENNGLGLAPALVERIVTKVEQAVVRLPDTDDAYAEWRRLVTLHSVSGKTAHDARLVAAMKVHGITHILTFNVEDFSRYTPI